MNTSKRKPTILYFSSCDFDFLYQRPQALARALSRRGATVYYVDPIPGSHTYANIPPPAEPGKEGPDGIRIIRTPYRWVKWGRMKTRLPEWLIKKRRTKWYLAMIDMLREKSDGPLVAIVVNPMKGWEIIRELPLDIFIYDCIDSSEIFAEGDEKRFKELETDIVRRSDIVLVTANRLAEHINKTGPKREPVSLPNGADVARLQELANSQPVHPAIAKLKKPVIGYLGAISEWIDAPLVVRTAQAFPDASIAMVGLMYRVENPSALENQPNIHLAGRVEHDEVAPCLKGFDVGIIPFRPGPIAECTDPIKAYEYLALGLPVVASHIAELKGRGDFARVTTTDEEFFEAIRYFLENDAPDQRALRAKYAENHSWDARAKTLLDAINRMV